MRLKYLRDNKVLLIYLIIPIVLGGLLYWLLCPDVFVVRIADSIMPIRRNASILSNPFILIIRNHLLDALWSFSLYCTLLLVLGNYKSALATALVFLVWIECLQIYDWCTGTFDVIDILAEVSALLLAFVITRDLGEERRHEESRT